jgi:hypothetical protein
MNSRLPHWLLLAALLLPLALRGTERNAWPFWVDIEKGEAAGTASQQLSFGPFYEKRHEADGSEWEAWRPLLLHRTRGTKESTYFLYPFFAWQNEATSQSFSFFQLVNNRRDASATGIPGEHRFDVWPFYFSRKTDDPATTYHAFFPVAGTIRQRFGKDRLTWYVFPLYFNTDKAGMEITSAPWPVIRFIDGAGHRGFEFWPLFGSREHPGDYRKRFWLWPLGYKQETNLSAPQPDVKLGALPFYARDTGPGYINETYLWPFFGYTHRTAPVRYDETRYLWPLLVQGRGDQRRVNRWAPVYTHSVVKGYDKTWYLWPLVRHASWQDAGLAQEKDQILFFLYWSLEQRSLRHPAAAPAYKKHLWPLVSAWDNGAGRRQFQLLSPLEVFFPNNEPVRQLYTPLFALYRYDQHAPGDVRQSLLWNLVSWRRSGAGKEFHLGPFGWHRGPDAPRGRLFLFAFHPQSAKQASAAPPP